VGGEEPEEIIAALSEALADFYGADFKGELSYANHFITLKVQQGSVDDGFGFKLPNADYVFSNGLEVVSYSDPMSGNKYDFNTTYSVTEDLNLTADWVKIVKIFINKNLNGDEDTIIIEAKQGSRINFSNEGSRVFITDIYGTGENEKQNKTEITFSDANYSLISFNLRPDGLGKGFAINQGIVELGSSFSINTSYESYLYCQWQGAEINILINYRDTVVEGEVTKKNVTSRYGADLDLSEHIPTSRKDGNAGYIFNYFEDENGKKYDGSAENPYIFNSYNLGEFKPNYELSVYWTEKEFTLTFNLPEASYTGTYKEVEYVDTNNVTINVLYNSTVTLLPTQDLTYDRNNIDFPLYVFDVWNSSIKINDSLTVENSFSMPASDVILTAVWRSRYFSLVFDAGEDGLFAGEKETFTVDELTIDDIFDFASIEGPYRTGYKYSYSYQRKYVEAENNFTETVKVTTLDRIDFSLYNKGDGTGYDADLIHLWNEEKERFIINVSTIWEPISYVLVYDNNVPNIEYGYEVNASGAVTGNIDAKAIKYDEHLDLAGSGVIKLAGWKQLGWTTEKDGSGEQYLFEDHSHLNVYNLTEVNGDTVTLYALWQQEEFVLNLVDNTNTNTDIEAQTIVFDTKFVLNDLLFTANPLEELCYDETNSYWTKFVGWKYVYGGVASDRTFTNEQEILFALSSYGGFINENDLADYEVTFEAVWEEYTYDLVLDLMGGRYSSARNDFGYEYNPDSGHFDIYITIKYSEIREVGGIDLTREGIEFDSALLAHDLYTFAGWSKEDNCENLDFGLTDNITFSGLTEEQLNPNGENPFKLYAMWNIYRVFVDGDGGEVVATKETVESEGWKISDNKESVYTYTYSNSTITIPSDVDSWFEKENY
ncbi:MAG: hypothetical protein IKA31_05225, partial [Clostridia bacterium]|nr:hypothetical protein [Clostridia bacterium]